MSNNDHPLTSPQALRRVQRREERATGAVILADVSLSMDVGDAASPPVGTITIDGQTHNVGDIKPGTRRIDRLAKVLAYVLTYTRLQCLVCFNDYPLEIPLVGHVSLPEPAGSTALHLALVHVLSIAPRPLRCMVLSDGTPNNPELALRAARRLRPMVIDAYYLGDDGDAQPLAFMRELAACGGPGGKSGVFDLSETRKVGETIRLLLTGPRG